MFYSHHVLGNKAMPKQNLLSDSSTNSMLSLNIKQPPKTSILLSSLHFQGPALVVSQNIIESQKYNFASFDAFYKMQHIPLNNIAVFSTPFASSPLYAEYSISDNTIFFIVPFYPISPLSVQF
eukprot:GHVN01036118.1.p1 GENE.GHVN01036118.1~~GHVN01036118.1.p1  ORF type:complete len:123 (-),score=6.57 GHVN01036118.1:149-517(-)